MVCLTLLIEPNIDHTANILRVLGNKIEVIVNLCEIVKQFCGIKKQSAGCHWVVHL